MVIVKNYILDLLESVNYGRLIVYGSSVRCFSIYNYFKVLGLEDCVHSYITENPGRKLDFPCNSSDSIYDLYDLDSPLFIILACLENSKAELKIRNIIGNKDIIFFYWPFDSSKKTDILDLMLGYSRSEDKEGYDIIRSEDKADQLRVIICGGSTSDPYFGPFRTWPTYLSEMLDMAGIGHEIFNGAIIGYNSSQELLKIVRDIGVLSPHIVVSLSGINDFYRGICDFKHPYTPRHITGNVFPVIENSLRNIDETATNTNMCDCVQIGHGIEHSESGADIWLRNMKMMEAICASCGIIFHGFLQPSALDEDYPLDDDLKNFINLQHSQNAILEITDNIVKASRSVADLKNVHDLTHLFKGCGNVFYDHCHFNEKGAEKIACAIYETLLTDEYIRNFRPLP